MEFKFSVSKDSLKSKRNCEEKFLDLWKYNAENNFQLIAFLVILSVIISESEAWVATFPCLT